MKETKENKAVADKSKNLNFAGNYNFSDSSKVFILNLLFKLVISFLLVYIISMVSKEDYNEYVSSKPWLGFLLTAIIPLLLCAIFFGYSKFAKKDIKVVLKPKQKFSFAMVGVCIGISLICFFMAGGVFNCIDRLFYLAGYNSGGELLFKINSVPRLLLSIFSMALLPAVFEELIYRGIVLSGMLSKFKPASAIGLTTLLFVLMHSSLDQTFFQLFLGLILTYIVYKTGCIYYSIIIHFINNVIVLVVNYVNSDSIFLKGAFDNPWYIISSILLFIGAIALLFFAFYIINKFFAVEKESKEKKVGISGIVLESTGEERILFFGALAFGLLIWLFQTASGFIS